MKIVTGLAACAALWLASAGWAGEAEVGAALDRFHQAAARADSDAYLALLTPDAVFLGTDGSERWQGQAFREFVLARFDAGEGWRYVPVSRHIRLAADGNSAWFDETLRNDALGPCRGSGVLLRDADAGWRVAQYNLSVPIPNAVLPQVVALVGTAPTATPGTAAQPAAGAPAAGALPAGAQTPAGAPGAATDTAAAAEEVSPGAAGKCARKRFKTNSKGSCDPVSSD